MARKKAAPAQIKIRLPEALRRDLERAATKSGRTLNGEIVHRLTQPFEQADREAIAEKAAEKAYGRVFQAESGILNLSKLAERIERKTRQHEVPEPRKADPTSEFNFDPSKFPKPAEGGKK
jgi:Arc-like DNA binding domain